MSVVQQKWRSELIETDDRFFALQDEWRQFHQSLEDPHSSPFLGWDWLYLWWITYRRPFWRLSIGVIRCDNRIVAVFPFYIKTLFIRQLFFLGTGEPEKEEVATEYLDCLMLKDCPDVLNVAHEWLQDYLKTIDLIVLQRMLESALLKTILPNNSHTVSKGSVCGRRYCLDLRGGREKLVSGFNSNLKRKYRKYSANTDLSFVVEKCDSADQLENYLSQLKSLHALRWRSKGKEGAFVSPRFVEFHKQYARVSFNHGQLFLVRLTMDGQVCACLYAIDSNRFRYFYQAGLQPDLQQWSPGHIAHFAAIDDAIMQDYIGYDFMMGGLTDSYKSQYVNPGEVLIGYVAAKYKWQLFFYQLSNKFQSWLSQ